MNLDHIGIVGRDLGEMAATFERLGFHLTPIARHAGGRTGNRCAMLRDGGYVELISTIDGGTSTTIDRFLACHAGIHLFALGIDDVAATQQRLALAWGKAPEVSHTDRAVDDPEGPRARFSLFGPFDRPEGRVHLIRHETPEALWQPRFLHHANMAVALEDIVVTAPQVAEAAAWYSTLVGRPVVPDADGGFALPLPHGRIRILPGPSPRIAAVVIRTSDGTSAVRQLLADRQIACVDASDYVQVEVAGAVIRFH